MDNADQKLENGVYPLLEDDCCYFLAVDFDEEQWQDDARAFMKSCDELGVPCALEVSRLRIPLKLDTQSTAN